MGSAAGFSRPGARKHSLARAAKNELPAFRAKRALCSENDHVFYIWAIPSKCNVILGGFAAWTPSRRIGAQRRKFIFAEFALPALDLAMAIDRSPRFLTNEQD
jgi:hypothetical protein